MINAIYPYHSGSEGARLLARAMRVPRIKRDRSRFVGSPRKTVINWGCHSLPATVSRCRIINAPEAVATVANKLSFFRKVTNVRGLNIPKWTTDRTQALEIARRGSNLVVRALLSSSGGRGATIVNARPGLNLGDIPHAPLYTEYVKKEAEFRIHVVNGVVIDATRKVARAGQEPSNWQIRSYDNGFIFQREGTTTHRGYAKACEQALLAMQAVGLVFGGVDVIYNAREDKAYVLEVNSAPGIEGTTVDKYKQAFERIR